MLPLERMQLRKAGALRAGTTVEGEREAAERLRTRLAELRGRREDDPFVCAMPHPRACKLLLALCRPYGLVPFWEYG